ncbi:MAG: DUF1801 domain-containing protein [Armatimonadota bacterium]
MASALDTFLAGVDTRFVPIVHALDRAVRRASADLETKISYQMLTYALAGDFRHWICAIGVTKKAVNLRFLYGVLLEDPRGVLRAGTSTLKTLDVASLDDVDAQLVTDYVTEAIAKLEAFKASARDQRKG